MPLRLDTAMRDFGERFADLLATKREVSEDVDAAVRDIIAHVRGRGDAALIDYSQRFDRVDLRTLGLAVAPGEIARAEAECDPQVLAALDLAMRAFAFFTRSSGLKISASPTISAWNSAGAGRHWNRSDFTCRAARQPIRLRC